MAECLVGASPLRPHVVERHGVGLQFLPRPVRELAGVASGRRAAHGGQAAVGARRGEHVVGEVGGRSGGGVTGAEGVVAEQRSLDGRGTVGLGIVEVVGRRKEELVGSG